MLSENDKFQLQQMMDKHPVEDQTNKIRELKHSNQLSESIKLLLSMKQEHATLLKENKPEFENLYLKQNPFLFYHYFELYNMVLKESINTTILEKLLGVLKKIEDGIYDQHEGSYVVGTILKEIYIDTKLKESSENKPTFVEPKAISWTEYKKIK